MTEPLVGSTRRAAEGWKNEAVDAQGRESRAGIDANETTVDSGPAHDGALVEPEPTGALVEVLPGLLIAYGGIDLKALDGAEVLDVDIMAVPGLTDAAAGALTGANLVAQGVQTALSARGLVRLAPETLQALRTAQPVVSGGWNLGTLAGGGGRFVQSVRWLPATSAQAVTILAGMGPAVALAAISAQASALANTAKRIENKLDALRAELEDRDLDKLKALLLRVHEVYDEVLQCGLENGNTRRSIEALAENRDLDEMYRRFLRKTRAYPTKNMQNATELIDTRGSVVSDLSALIAVWQARDLVGIMSIGALLAEGPEENLLNHRAQKLQRDLHRREAEVTNAVSSIHSRAHLLLIEEENLGLVDEARKRFEGVVKSLPFGGGSDAPSLGDAVGMIDEAVDAFDDARLAAPEPLAPEIQDGEANAAQNVREALRWLLEADEELLALVEVGQEARHLVVTTSRWGLVTLRVLLTTKLDALRPLEDVRYVVDDGLKDSGRTVHIVTRADVVSVTFKKAEAGTSRETAVDRALSLLRTAMNLPDDEREHDPLLSLPRPARDVLGSR